MKKLVTSLFLFKLTTFSQILSPFMVIGGNGPPGTQSTTKFGQVYVDYSTTPYNIYTCFATSANCTTVAPGSYQWTGTIAPMQGTLAARPATCQPGLTPAFYQALDQPAGNQLYLCTSTNTWTLVAGGGGGSGTVTSFSSGNLSPLFTTSVSNPTTTPSLSFSQVAQNANLLFAGPSSGTAANPTFRALVKADLPSLTSGTSILAGDGNGFFTNVTIGSGLTFSGGTLSATGGGSGTVTSVGLSLPSIFTVSGSPVTTSGTLTGTLNTQNANVVWAGPSSGSAAAPTFRALVGADLPNPSSSSLGGIQSFASVAHQWINSISTSGVPSATQPAFSDLSGSAACSQLPALTGDTTSSAGSCATTTAKINGTAFPASAHVINSNSSSQPGVGTAHDVSAILVCTSSSGSGTTYTCSTSPTFTPAAGDTILWQPDLANTGSATLNVNSQGAKTLKKQSGTVNLAANDICASPAQYLATYDGTNWEVQGQLCSASSGGGSIITSGTWSAMSNPSSNEIYQVTDSPGMYGVYVSGSGWSFFDGACQVYPPVSNSVYTAPTFSQRNFGSITTATNYGAFTNLFQTSNNGGSVVTAGMEIPIPSSPFNIDIFFYPTWSQQFNGMGLYYTDGTKLVTFDYLYDSGNQMGYGVGHLNSVTSFSAWALENGSARMPQAPIGLRINFNSGTATFYFSNDCGFSWVRFYSESTTAWTSTPTNIGFQVDMQATNTGFPNGGMTLLSWHQH